MGPGPKNVIFVQILQAKTPTLTISKRLKFCTFYPIYNSTVLAKFQLWHKSSSLISCSLIIKIFFFFIFGELYLYNPKFRDARIDCCSNIGSCV